MHGDSWFPFFGFGHWGLGLLVWLLIIVAIIAVFKLLFPTNKD